jgi:mono/diheme cytochrome c family protein
VLAVYLFVAFWAILALGLLFLAGRGGFGAPSRPGRRATPSSRKATAAIFAIIYVGFGVVIPAVFLVGNHNRANAQVGGLTLTSAEKTGRELFGQHCGVCHTLAATNSIGKVGPNLDVLRPAESTVLHTINNGCVQNAAPTSAENCLGYGTMDAGIIQGKQAQDVAQFVARVAGQE